MTYHVHAQSEAGGEIHKEGKQKVRDSRARSLQGRTMYMASKRYVLVQYVTANALEKEKGWHSILQIFSRTKTEGEEEVVTRISVSSGVVLEDGCGRHCVL